MSDRPLLLQPDPRARRIEDRAAECVRHCCEALDLRQIPLPIPVDRWIEAPLNIRFGISNLSHIGPNVLGAASPSQNEILISDSILSHEARYRFTCAHELGHMTLHKRKGRAFQDARERPADDLDRLERQADRFAAAFLMPVPLLSRELIRICDERKVKHTDGIVELMLDTPESDWLWKKAFLPALTRRFGMSLQATLFRFRELRRIDGKSFLFDRQIDRLLRSAAADDPLHDLNLVNGFPRPVKEKSLFD